MPNSIAHLMERYLGTVSRRDLFRTGGLLTLPAWLGNVKAAPASVAPGLKGQYLDQINHMIADFGKMGVVERRPGPTDPDIIRPVTCVVIGKFVVEN